MKRRLRKRYDIHMRQYYMYFLKIVYQVQTKEIITTTVCGYLILSNIHFYDFSSPVSPQFYSSSLD